MQKLNVICVYYNFCKYKKRKQLTLEYINRMSKYENINLYVCELVLEGDEFEITNKLNSKHLQLTTKYILWYKENLINLTVNKLLEKNWSSFAWIDCDLEFENTMWVNDTLEKIKTNDILQLFSYSIRLDINNNKLWENISIIKFNKDKTINLELKGHSGFAWAISRDFYDKINKLPELFIIGGADTRMASGIFNIDKFFYLHNDIKFNPKFIKYILELNIKFKNIKCDYIDVKIYHYYHGDYKDRQYFNRHKLLSEYNPYEYIKYNSDGLITPTTNFPKDLLKSIKNYFENRNEDNLM